MRQTVIEGTGIPVSRLGFGTASLHHLFRSRDRLAVLRAAAQAGITHFDTSPYYGYGLAETDLGALLRERRTSFTVTTKVGLYPRGPASGRASSVWLRKAVGKLVPRLSLPEVNWRVERACASLGESLQRLGTDYVDFLFLHEPDTALLNTDEMLHWLEMECAKGRLRAWGVAGVANRVAPWVQNQHSLARVVQTQDSLERRQADFLQHAGRPLQFTYGYLSGLAQASQPLSPVAALRAALQRNTTGTVLFSTRRVEAIVQLTQEIV